jgi:hypothetical protein
MAINYNEEEFGLQLPNTNQEGITDVAFKPGSALDKQIKKLNTLEQMGYPQQNLQNLKDMDMKQFKETGTPLSLPRDQYAMAISNYDELFGPKTMTDSFGTSHNLAAVNRPDLYTGDLMAKTGQRLRDPFAPFQNEMVGPNPHDPSVYDRYGNIQMGLENPDVDPYEEQKGLAALFQNLNIDPSSWGTSLKNKASTGWDFAKQLPGMAMGALSGIPGIGMAMGLLRNMARPDNPYQAFQKQTFKDMGWQGDPNKDPWGKNIRSMKDTYDVTEQWGDLMGTKLGEKYGYADAFADGVLSDAELAEMQALGLKGWQLNRAIGLSTAAKKAQDWKDKKAAEKLITNQMKNIDTGGKTKTYTPPTKQGTTGSWTPGGTYTGGGASWSPAGKSPSQNKGSSYSRGSYGGRGHHWAKGGRVGYGNGGLATLFTRRG